MADTLMEVGVAGEENEAYRHALDPSNEPKPLLIALNALGRLPATFDMHLFLPLLSYPHEEVRLGAAKNIGKRHDKTNLGALCSAVFEEENTLVRREMVSAIGRMRDKGSIPVLERLLEDVDAKVVLQAIRALLCFKKEPEVQRLLLPLLEHPNELIQGVVRKELHTADGRQKSREKSHKSSPRALKNLLVNADVLEALRHVPEESIHLTFTSPPYYNARDYTLYPSYEDYLQFLVKVFTEVHRVTKEGRFFALNTSPVLIPRMGRNHSSTRYLIPFDIHPLITKIGFEFIDDIVWIKPDPSAKNRNGGFFQHRKPLGYKANSVCEYVIVYRKKTDKLLDWNIDQYPTEIVEASKILGDYEKTNAWKIAPASDPVHSAIFPKELAARVIQFYSYKGDLVFDPFAGSGTVGQIASLLERYYFLTEQDPTYAKYAHEGLCVGSLYTDCNPCMVSLAEFQDLLQREASL
jgi:DNA modification methylase